jgi:oxygen-independent coproporphyrinogen-3 oxidase
VPHISAYALTIEPQTALHHFIKSGKLNPINEYSTVQHYKLLCKTLKNAGYEHYEISNFAKPNFYSIHNTSYWQQKNYMGIGPSAHSFNGNSRQWNIKNNALYLKKIKNRECFFEKEELSYSTRYNEYLLTGLRTIWGIEKKYLTENFSNFLPAFSKQKEKLIKEKLIKESELYITLTEKGKLFADQIASNFFIV